MKHPDDKMWFAYIEDNLNETERRVMEDHLALCDRCLAVFLQALESRSAPADEPVFTPGWTDAVMAESARLGAGAAQTEAAGLEAGAPPLEAAGPIAGAPLPGAARPEADAPLPKAARPAAGISSVPPAADLASSARRSPPRRRRWLDKPILLYGAAAAVTILLMISGVFGRLAEQVGHMQAASHQQQTTVSDRLMERTVTWIDTWQAKEKGGQDIEH